MFSGRRLKKVVNFLAEEKCTPDKILVTSMIRSTMTDVAVEYTKRAVVERFLCDSRRKLLNEKLVVVNERLEQCFVQLVSLQSTNAPIHINNKTILHILGVCSKYP